MLFTSADAGTTYDYTYDPNSSSNRLMKIEHPEFPFGGSTQPYIILRNEDHLVPDLRGYWIEIGYGNYSVAGGNEYVGDGTSEPGVARMWVEDQGFRTAPGQQFSTLFMLTMYHIIEGIPFEGGSKPDHHFAYVGQTVYEIMEDLIETYTPFTLKAIGAVDDGIINTLKPDFAVNEDNAQPSGLGRWESIGQCVYRLLSITKLYLRANAGLEFELVHPQEGDSVDETYEAPLTPVTGKHTFYGYNENHKLVIPNEISVFGGMSEDGTWGNYVEGISQDTAEQARFMEMKRLEVFASLSSQSDCADQALAYLSREKSEQFSGIGVVPHDSRFQLYDKPQFWDNR